MAQGANGTGVQNLSSIKTNSINQAYTPNTNEEFIVNTIDKLINEERYSECPNHQKVKKLKKVK
jgi:hypothetical protein